MYETCTGRAQQKENSREGFGQGRGGAYPGKGCNAFQHYRLHKVVPAAGSCMRPAPDESASRRNHRRERVGHRQRWGIFRGRGKKEI